MSDGPLIQFSNSVLRRLFFRKSRLRLANGAIATLFGGPYAAGDSVIANQIAQLSEPETRPRELNAKNRKAHRNNYYGRARRNNHDYPDRDYRSAQHRDDYAPRRFIRQMYCSLDQRKPPKTTYLPRDTGNGDTCGLGYHAMAICFKTAMS